MREEERDHPSHYLPARVKRLQISAPIAYNTNTQANPSLTTLLLAIYQSPHFIFPTGMELKYQKKTSLGGEG